jgi:hypothetical protein
MDPFEIFGERDPQLVLEPADPRKLKASGGDEQIEIGRQRKPYWEPGSHKLVWGVDEDGVEFVEKVVWL